jgi:hypothetical protein
VRIIIEIRIFEGSVPKALKALKALKAQKEKEEKWTHRLVPSAVMP